LQNVQYSKPNEAPFAVLKAANNAELTAIGRGTLSLAGLQPTAYIFRQGELATNLLGLAPFCDLGCEAIFSKNGFKLFGPNQSTPFLTGSRSPGQSLWKVNISMQTVSDHIPPPYPIKEKGLYIEANCISHHDNASYVRFVHAAMGYPAPSTFMTAVTNGYITGPGQYTKLTPKMVRKHMPNAIATARGHLDKARAKQPHQKSEAVSALQRHHNRQNESQDSKHTLSKKPFNLQAVPKSTTLHIDYTGNLPEIGSNGTRLYLISCWGKYIHIQPLTNLRDEATTTALKECLAFWRENNIVIETIRLDNQTSAAFTQMAKTLHVALSFVSPYDKGPNRAERAIRTAKNHLIAVRAGFHGDCPTVYLDKCLQQIEMTLNIIHPYEYDPCISAYEGVLGHTFNFKLHPIAPVGAKVLTWDSPDHRGTWADHGVEAVYLGPATDHLRSFRVWVPHTSAERTTNTVWWFLKDLKPDEALLHEDDTLAYPPTRNRPNPRNNGTDLVGRHFVEPELGVCVILGPGPVVSKKLATRAQIRRRQTSQDPTIPHGTHYTLRYLQTNTREEHYSSVTEIIG
jgi:hypothetical protein